MWSSRSVVSFRKGKKRQKGGVSMLILTSLMSLVNLLDLMMLVVVILRYSSRQWHGHLCLRSQN